MTLIQQWKDVGALLKVQAHAIKFKDTKADRVETSSESSHYGAVLLKIREMSAFVFYRRLKTTTVVTLLKVPTTSQHFSVFILAVQT